MVTPQPLLSIRLFGNFSIEVDGRPFVMATPRRTLPILAYLLLNRSTAISRESLAYLMWPDDAEEAARTKLRANLHDLNRVLPPAGDVRWIAADGDNVAWNPDSAVHLDVDEFESLCARPERAHDAVELYRGDLLATLYDEWLYPARERYRNLYLGALSELLSEARRKRDFPKAIARAQQLLGVDPWREDIVRRLIAVRYESGDRTGALIEYQRFSERLRAELQIEPMPETIALREAISLDAPVEPEPAAKSPHALRPAPPAALLPFVGRERELERLTDAWNRAAQGNGGAVFVGGESGIGKSRLALEFAHRVEELGGRVMVGSTGTPEALPYQSLVEALRSALPLVASLRVRDVWLAGVATLVPELRAHLPALPELPRIASGSERPRLFESLARTLAALAQARPVLIVLEDLQWAEEATCAALEFLLGRLSALRVLILITYRDNEVARTHPLQRLRRDTLLAGSASDLSLRALSLGNVEELVRSLPAAFAGSAAALFASSDGSPIFITQLVEAGHAGSDDPASAGVRALVAERIGTLSSEARTIAEIAALAGERFSRDVVYHVSGWSGGAADDALDELVDRRIVREASGRGFFDYVFAHSIVQQTVAQSAQAERSASRHRRIARALEELYPERAAELSPSIARHYHLAGEAGAAARCYLSAARQAISVGALDEAATHLTRGLELTTDAELRVDLLLGSETLAARRLENTLRASLLDALEEAGDGAGTHVRANVLLRRIGFASDRADRATEAAALARLRSLLEGESDARWIARLRQAEAQHCFTGGDLAAAEVHAAGALTASLEAGDPLSESEARYSLAEIVTHRGDLARAEALFEDARSAGERARNAPLSIRALAGSYQLAFTRRDMQRCLEIAQATLAAGLASGDRRSEAEGHTRIATTLIGMVAYTEARKHFAAAAEIFREVGDDLGTAQTLLHTASLQLAIGDMTGARQGCERALQILAPAGPSRRTITGLMALSGAEAYGGAPQLGKAHANEALELSRRMGFRVLEASALEDLAYTEVPCGEHAAAIEHMQQALAIRAETGSLAWTGVSQAYLALWYAIAGNLDAARKHEALACALEETFAQSSPSPQACWWALAQARRACGEQQAAQDALRRAHALLVSKLERLDGADRAHYVKMFWNRDIVAAAECGVWPDPPR